MTTLAELTEKDMERQKEVEEAFDKLVNLTNYFGSEKYVTAGILASLNRSHRTLQQSFWRAMYQVMKQYGEDEWCDLRNQASKDFCREVIEKVEAYFPMV